MNFIKKAIAKFYYQKIFESVINGPIIVMRRIFNYEIRNGECYQSADYVNRLWRKLLFRVPKKSQPHNVLLLGLGGGGGIIEILKRFKPVNIYAVEHDPVMVEIAKQTYLQKKIPTLKIIIDDALNFVQSTNEKFDIIMVDLYKGKVPAPILKSPDFLNNLKRILTKEGYLLVNFFLNKADLSPEFNTFFSNWQSLHYKYNQMVVYRNFGLGNPRDPIPSGYLNKEQSELYLRTTNRPCWEIITSTNNIKGVRNDYGIFAVEKYISAQEPVLSSYPKPRIIYWRPINDLKRKKGWGSQFWHKKLFRQIGFTELIDNNYWQNWSKHAQRHRKKWLSNTEYEITEAKINDFAKAYHQSKLTDVILRRGLVSVIKYHLSVHPDNVHLFVVRQKNNTMIVSGLAVIDFPDISQSTHFISFLHKSAKKSSIGVGLIEHWHQYCLKKRIRFLNFGIYWQKGDPHAWQGFSIFKNQFNIYKIRYIRQKFKIVLKSK